MRSDVIKNRRALFLSLGRTREEIARRLAGWSPPPLPKELRSYLKRYSALATSASTGAVLRQL